jgi:E3 SUMO-protein ligase PIAS1
MNDILSSTQRSVDQVTVEPDGTWSQIAQKEIPGRSNGAHSSDDDDDLVEIQNMPRLTAIKDEALPTPTSMARTPPYSSREPSASSAAPRSIGSKRQVIDLTFSSDEEDQTPRDPKRQMTQASSSTLFGPYSTSGMPMRRPSDHSASLARVSSLGYGQSLS